MVQASLKKIIDWVKKHKWEVILIVSILLIGSFMRLYRIGEYMTFLGDEGRDAIVVRRLIVDFDPILVGPGTSIGNMYLGPLYYYFIAPGLLFSGLSPVGPSVQIAIFGILTIALVWWTGREWFGKWAGLSAALLYAIAPTVIIYSRSSWNPNIMPFLAILSVYAIWRVYQHLEYKWLLLIGVSFAFVLQSHYLGLVLAPVLGTFWFLTLRKADNKKRLLLFTVLCLLIFAFLMSPLLIFDYRHGWRNVEALKLFFTERQTTVSARPWSALPQSWPLLKEFSTRLLAGRNELLGAWVAAGLLGSILAVATSVKKDYLSNKSFKAFLLLFVWFGFAVLGLGVYKQHIYDHYFGFFFAAPFLILGGVIQILVDRAKIRGAWIALVIMIFLVFYNLADSPLRHSPNRQLQRTEAVSSLIQQEAGDQPFNFALIAEMNYEAAYQFFFEKWHSKFVEIDPQRSDETITSQLFVACELEDKDKCDPTHNSKAQVANFGWSKIENQWDVNGVRIYKLSHVIPE